MKHATIYGLPLALCLATGPAFAADEGDMDVTMSIVEDSDKASEKDFVNDIELPEPARGPEATPPSEASEEAHENAAHGQETSQEARQQGSEGDRGRSDEARDGQGPPDDNGMNGGNGPPNGGQSPGGGAPGNSPGSAP